MSYAQTSGLSSNRPSVGRSTPSGDVDPDITDRERRPSHQLTTELHARRDAADIVD